MTEFLEGSTRASVFILTDGTVHDPQEVIDLCVTPSIVVNTVGIGDGIDEPMLQKCALVGRGCCSIIRDDESAAVLNGKIIKALKNWG